MGATVWRFDIACQRCGAVLLYWVGAALPDPKDGKASLMVELHRCDGKVLRHTDAKDCESCEEPHLPETFDPKRWGPPLSLT